ncbi:MAG: hypothetical protein P4M14_03560 [Gammaproteobacteria bacterium]|nr:hypothetical protein [Gammaproteobacteria bacterium]
MMQAKELMRGFSIIELFLTLIVIIVLAAMAVPAYFNFKHRAYYSDIVKATAPFQEAVATCYQNLKTLTGCNGGTNHIPANIEKAKAPILSLTVHDGVISVVPVASHQTLVTDNFIFTPKIVNKAIVWDASGDAVKKGYAP